MDLNGNSNIINNKFDKNIILYGPPGTGKTYNTAIYAVAICNEKSVDEVRKMPYEQVIEQYNELKDKEKRIIFITFHQSYGYEEFIEGIKPVVNRNEKVDRNEISYDVVSGVFKEFCERAIEFNGEHQFRIAWKKLIEAASDKQNKYSFTQKNGSVVNAELLNQNTFRFSWNGNEDSYNDFTEENVYQHWISKRSVNDVSHKKVKWLYCIRDAIIEELKQRFGLEENCKNVTNYVFIIDEINRGNISKIFGELITLIEPAKRIGQPEEMRVKLPYSKKDFGISDNVYIIGTMNTADRSIAAIDTALRRRFSFKEMMPQKSVLNDIEVEGILVSNMLEKINKRIEILYDREHTIGHTYFMPLFSDNSITVLADIFKSKILPLLQEYFYEDYDKIRLVLGDNQKDKELQFIQKTEPEKDLFGEDTDVIDDAYKYSINEEAFNNIEAYKSMV